MYLKKISYISDMTKVLRYKGQGTLAEKREKRKAAWIARKMVGVGGSYLTKVGSKLLRVKVVAELEHYIPGHVRSTAFIYNSEESELSRMIKVADRIALRNKK